MVIVANVSVWYNSNLCCVISSELSGHSVLSQPYERWSRYCVWLQQTASTRSFIDTGLILELCVLTLLYITPFYVNWEGETERRGDRKKTDKTLPVLFHSLSPHVFLITGLHASHSEVSGMSNLNSLEPAALNLSSCFCLQLIDPHWFTSRDWTMTCALPLLICPLSYPGLCT